MNVGESSNGSSELNREIDRHTQEIEGAVAGAKSLAHAYYNRGVRYGERGAVGDTDREIDDYARVVELPDAPADIRAFAVLNRGITRLSRFLSHGNGSDLDGAIADLTQAIGSSHVEGERPGMPQYQRGVCHSLREDSAGLGLAIADFSDVIALKGAPSDLVARALYRRAVAYVDRDRPGDLSLAREDFNRVIAMAEASGEIHGWAMAGLVELCDGESP